MTKNLNFVQGMYDASPGVWSYPYAYGYLEGLVEDYLSGKITQERFTARFAVIGLFYGAYDAFVTKDGYTPAAAMAEIVRHDQVVVEAHPSSAADDERSPG